MFLMFSVDDSLIAHWREMNCDVIVSSCTMTAHVAGAVACPLFVALRCVPDWRWLMDRDDSPSYPTARLFRQDRPGDWAGVVAPHAVRSTGRGLGADNSLL
jgi:hypothetical protein